MRRPQRKAAPYAGAAVRRGLLLVASINEPVLRRFFHADELRDARKGVAWLKRWVPHQCLVAERRAAKELRKKTREALS